MISVSNLDAFKQIAEMQVNIIPGGAIFLIIEGDTFVWKAASNSFDLKAFDVGMKLDSRGVTVRAMAEKKTLVEKVPRVIYGKRLVITSAPVVNEEGKVVGAVSIVIPRLHPVAAAFNSFAPILADMFPEGAFIYMSDLTKIAYRQPSKKFDIPSIPVGYALKENDNASKAIKSKQLVVAEYGAEKWGVPTLFMTSPLFDEDNGNEVVATFGIAIPKSNAIKLREMSQNINTGLEGISAAIEQLAASASTIHKNELELNQDIKEVAKYVEDINKITGFIKQVADATKMLGLNAAIEAARAGEAGKGFSVVADEIRKLSDQSKSTVPQINELTGRIKNKLNVTSNKSETSLLASQEQSAATQEITASIEEMASLSDELNTIAKNS